MSYLIVGLHYYEKGSTLLLSYLFLLWLPYTSCSWRTSGRFCPVGLWHFLISRISACIEWNKVPLSVNPVSCSSQQCDESSVSIRFSNVSQHQNRDKQSIFLNSVFCSKQRRKGIPLVPFYPNTTVFLCAYIPSGLQFTARKILWSL